MRFYLGTYTRLGGPGIAICCLDGDKMSIHSSVEMPDPTYIIHNQAGNRLFAASDPVIDNNNGAVASFSITETGLEPLSYKQTVGSGPCHICLSADERFLYCAHYYSGLISVYPVNEDGYIGACIQLVEHHGHSVHPVRQIAPHVHQLSFIPKTNLLCSVDLGIDALMIYEQDASTGRLTFSDRLNTPPGSGPRHILFGENDFAFLVCEIDNRVLVLRRSYHAWHLLQSISTLPAEFQGNNTASAIRRQGNRIYVSNRGHNSIAVFEIGYNSLLTGVGIYPTGDDFPRDFDFIGNRMIIAHQKGCVILSKVSYDGIFPVSRLNISGAVCVLHQ